MMKSVKEWARNHRLCIRLCAVLFILLLVSLANDFSGGRVFCPFGYRNVSVDQETPMVATQVKEGGVSLFPEREAAPSESKERLVVKTSSLSLVVDNVRQASDEVVNYAQKIGGFMVSTSLAKPQEAPFATIVVRVPAEKLSETLDYLRSLAVKVSSENILGQDVTDQYENIGARLETLNKTKAKFEEILDKADKVQDILQVQRELTSLQAQIDSLKGRKEYLEKTAKLAKVTVYLSTDEWALPYHPQDAFRPKVIFKQAVRSLIKTARGLAKILIWMAVYLPVWGGILLIIFVAKRLKKRRKRI